MQPSEGHARPAWGRWPAADTRRPWTVGIEEEVMLLHSSDYALAPWIDSILPTLPVHLADHVDAETHSSALELRTGVHDGVSAAIDELATLRGGASRRSRCTCTSPCPTRRTRCAR